MFSSIDYALEFSIKSSFKVFQILFCTVIKANVTGLRLLFAKVGHRSTRTIRQPPTPFFLDRNVFARSIICFTVNNALFFTFIPDANDLWV